MRKNRQIGNTGHNNSQLFKLKSVAALLMTGSISITAMADGTPQIFNIPALQLDNALTELADKGNLRLLYQAERVSKLRSKRVSGKYSAEEALKILLNGSGLSFRKTADNAFTVEPSTEPVKKTNPEPQSATTLPAVKVIGSAVYDVKDPYNEDYVLPNATAGTKTDTPIMETPLNVQVISKQVLKDQQIFTLPQALKNVSGVSSGGIDGSQNNLFFRGFETYTFFRNGFRLDNPSGYSMGLGDRQFANVESVEVLKGASAILYGRVEPGGMVNVVTKQPLATPYYALSQQFGSYNTYRTNIDSTGPLTKDDTLLYRINASFQNQGSFKDGVNTENFFIAPIVKWNISPRTQATLEMEYQHDTAVQGSSIIPSLNNQSLPTPISRNYFSRNNVNIQDTYFIGFNWSHQFNDEWSLKHRVQVNKNDFSAPLGQYQSLVFPVSGNPTLALPQSSNQISLDTYATGIDLTGHFTTGLLKHTLLFGGDYYRYAVNAHSTNKGILGVSLLNPVQPGSLLTGVIEPGTDYSGLAYNDLFGAPGTDSAWQNTIDNYGLYGQDQIELPYHVYVLGGIRYQYIHETASNDFGGVPSSDPVITADAVTPRVGLLWQPQHWLSMYGNYAEGFGVNGGFTYPDRKSVPPTGAEQWEIGAKTEFFDGRLRATLAYFDLTKTNIATSDPIYGSLGFSRVTGAARSRGPELDIQGEILPGWNVIGTYANLDARVTQSNNGDVGSRFYNVPRNKGSIWTTYEIQQGDVKGFKFGGGVTLQDSLVGGFSGTAAQIPGYSTVNLMSGYSFKVGKSKISLQLNIDNLLDKHYYTGGANYTQVQNIGYGYVWDYRVFGMPRTVMGLVSVQY